MKKLSKILALALVLVMVFAVVSAFSMTTSAANIPAGTVLYLVPNANWNQSNARFAAYFFGSGEAWVSMTKVPGETNLYQVTVPAGSWTNVIFCRMNPSAAANNWNNKWNQTSDLTYNGTSNCYTVKEGTWDKGAGTWSTYGSTCAHTNLGPAATCTEDQKCLDCGDPVVSALGHTYNTAHLCTRCNTQATFTVAGSGAHLGTEWDTGNTANDMTYADGVYTKVYTNVAAGSYLLKVARDHDWGTAYPDADKAYTVSTSGSTVTVTLKGTTVTIDVTVPHVHNYVAGEVVAPTYTAGGYTVYTCSCGLTENRDQTPALEVKLPEVAVSDIDAIVDGIELTFALNFAIKNADTLDAAYLEALMNTYGNHYVDYVLTVEGLSSEKVVFNTTGGDAWLAGRYAAWAEGAWISVPGSSVELKNGESLFIMEKASVLLGKSGLRVTLEEIAEIVQNFDCGVYFTPEFLAANPDMKVTLELIVFTEEDGVKTLVDGKALASNEFTVPHVHNYEAVVTAPTCETAGYTTYTCACGDTYTGDEVAALGHSYFYNVCLTCLAPNPYFEYNFMVTGTNKVIANEYHLVDTEGHGFPYQFTTFTVTEAGHYVFTSDKMIGFTIFTIEVNTEGADWTTGTGASWGEYIVGNEVDLEAGTYYVGMIFIDGLGEYEVTIEKAAEECTEHVDANEDYVCDNCGAELERPEDPTPVDPVEPEEPAEEELGFWANLWAKILAFLNSIVEFFKNLF